MHQVGGGYTYPFIVSISFFIIIYGYWVFLAFMAIFNIQITLNNVNYDYNIIIGQQIVIMILGKLNLDRLIWIYFPAMLLTPLYTYHMAVSKGQEPPYPHATVTSTAEHYPQNIQFRFVMLFCSSLIALIFFVVFRWLQFQAKRVGFQPPHKYLFYLAQFSILCYGITIGTIDGHGGGTLHGPCAVIFFVIWFATIMNLSVYMDRLRRWDTSVMSKSSLTLKLILAIYVAGVWIWCIYSAATQKYNSDDIYLVILQWNSVFINLLWVLTMVIEWKDFVLCLNRKK